MIIKKFVEKDSRSAMAKVREEFGADAVVLSSRSVGDSFEMVAAANYDEHDILHQLERQEDSIEDRSGQGTEASKPLAANTSGSAGQGSVGRGSVNHNSVGLETMKAGSARTAEAIRSELISSNEQTSWRAAKASRPEPDDGPSLKTLQTELADLRTLIQRELPRYAGRSVRSANTGQTRQHKLKARLIKLGLSASLSEDLLVRLGKSENLNKPQSQKESWAHLIKLLVGKIRQNTDSLIDKGGIAAFVGPVGSGKTSMVAKIAASHLMTHGRGSLGLITTGGLRDRKNERLLKFAQSMDIPCREANTATTLKAALDEFAGMKLVLIDTPGVDCNDLRLTMQLAEFRLANHPIQNYLVVSAETSASALEKSIDAFSRYQPRGLVVTRVDTSARLGAVIETLINKRMPLGFISVGKRIPADLRIGGAKDLMKMALAGITSSRNRHRKATTPKSVASRTRKLGVTPAVKKASTSIPQRAVG